MSQSQKLAAAAGPAAEALDRAFRTRLSDGDLPDLSAPASLKQPALAAIFAAQCRSRFCDYAARAMQAQGKGFYTIGSAGHEGMAAVAAAFRASDPAFLHYRDGAFQLARSAQAGETGGVRDILLSLAAARDDPVSGGRHKVLGSASLMIPPQTSTIASHLPKAVGAAWSVGLARRLGATRRRFADDAVVLCAFGDASANHSTAQAGLNTAAWIGYRGLPLPLLFVCEDNGIGISTRTPEGWIAARFSALPGLTYLAAERRDPASTHARTQEAIRIARIERRPVFLHLSMVRLMGHAGSDLEASYRPKAEIAADAATDPLLFSAARLREAGATEAEVLAAYDAAGAEVAEAQVAVEGAETLRSSEEVMATILPKPNPAPPPNMPDPKVRARTFGADFKALDTPQPMNRLINWALSDLMLANPEVVIMGEDVGPKGGVYGVTQKLVDRFGRARVIDTLLDETSILGLGLGMAQNGLIPIPEIQFLAYFHNAEDQIRGEGATLPFFSQGQFTNPMVLRIAGLGYQRGFGGHFHNDNSLAVLRDIPGLILACPSDGAEAALMLREALRLARDEGRIVAFIEPIALYAQKDLTPGDGGWLRPYPAPDQRAEFGTVAQRGTGTDLAIVTYGNGVRMAELARAELDCAVRIIDLRWLAPLPESSLLAALEGVSPVLVVDECRRSGNVSEGLMTLLAEHGRDARRLCAEDSFIATGPAHAATLPSVAGIVAAAQSLLAGG